MENNQDQLTDASAMPKKAWKSPLEHVPSWLRNKYLLALAGFAVIMLFLDKNDIFTSMARNKELNDLQQSKIYYTNEIKELNQVKDNLTQDPRVIEKYAREKYLMKRDNEDLFLIPEKPVDANNQ